MFFPSSPHLLFFGLLVTAVFELFPTTPEELTAAEEPPAGFDCLASLGAASLPEDMDADFLVLLNPSVGVECR